MATHTALASSLALDRQESAQSRKPSLRTWLQVFCGGDFAFLEKLSEYMPVSNVTFLDAGANIGAVSVLFAHIVRGGGQVLAVEAHPVTFQLAQNNTVSWTRAITIVHGALVSEAQAAASPDVDFQLESNRFSGFRARGNTAEADHSGRGVDGSQHSKGAFQVKAVTLRQLQVHSWCLIVAATLTFMASQTAASMTLPPRGDVQALV